MLSQTGASHTETIVKFMEKQKILLPDAFTIKLRKAVNQVFNASERKKPQTLQGNISLISQLIPNLDEIKSEVYKERFEAVKSLGRADFFKPEIYNEKPLTKEKKKEEKIKNKVFQQMLVELTKPKNEKAETKQNTKEKEGNPNKQEEKKVASSDPNPLNPKELAQLKEIYLCELKCQAFEKMLNLLTKAKKDLKRDTIRIKQAFERSSNRQLMEIRGKMLELKDKTDTLNREIMRMEKELNQIKVSQEKNDIETKIQNFIKSASSEEAGQTKLRDYLVVLKKTIEIYYRSAEILEGGLFQKNSGDLIDSALDQLEDLLDNVPFGKYVAKTFKAAKWVYNYRNEVIQDNNYKTFSSLILNSDKLGYILEASALELIMHKKNLILNSSDTIEKTFMEKLDEKSKTMFIQKERLAKGLDTGAKKMGAIDAACIIANAYTNLIAKPKQGIDCDDIYGTKRTIDLFVECGKLIDETTYLDLLTKGELHSQLSKTKQQKDLEAKKRRVKIAKKIFCFPCFAFAKLFRCCSGGKNDKTKKKVPHSKVKPEPDVPLLQTP